MAKKFKSKTINLHNSGYRKFKKRVKSLFFGLVILFVMTLSFFLGGYYNNAKIYFQKISLNNNQIILDKLLKEELSLKEQYENKKTERIDKEKNRDKLKSEIAITEEKIEVLKK